MSALLVLLLDIHDALQQAVGFHVLDAKHFHSLAMVDNCHDTLQDLNLTTTTSLHCFHLINSWYLFFEDSGFYVKLQSTIWFTKFMVDQYDND